MEGINLAGKPRLGLAAFIIQKGWRFASQLQN
jgi:hypothetical protein